MRYEHILIDDLYHVENALFYTEHIGIQRGYERFYGAVAGGEKRQRGGYIARRLVHVRAGAFDTAEGVGVFCHNSYGTG